MSKKHNDRIELSELISDAVNNAVARRHQALETEEALTDLSQNEVEAIRGGLKASVEIIAGYFPVPKEAEM
jgi:DNA-binding transcriptional regulator YiaG